MLVEQSVNISVITGLVKNQNKGCSEKAKWLCLVFSDFFWAVLLNDLNDTDTRYICI